MCFGNDSAAVLYPFGDQLFDCASWHRLSDSERGRLVGPEGIDGLIEPL